MAQINQQSIKNSNLKSIYNHIYESDGISRTQLSKSIGLSKTTISTLVNELIEREFIYDSGTSVTEDVGRNPNYLHIQFNSYYVINVLWINNSVEVDLVDIAGKTVYSKNLRLKKNDTYISLSKKHIYESLLNKVSKDKILGITIVVSAMVDPKRNIFYSTTLNMSGGEQKNLIPKIKETFNDFPVALLNDTACYAYAEKVYANVKESDFVFINFSYGIGATLFINNQMVGNANGATTQFGHYSVDPNGKTCVCGNRGCIEATMGEHVLKERVKETGNSNLLNNLEQVTFADLGEAAKQGDKIAQDVIKSMAKEFSYALSNLISIVHPKLIVLGGKSKGLESLFLNEIRNNLKHTGFKKLVEEVNISYSKLNQKKYILGSMKYFFDMYFKFTDDLAGSMFIG